MIGKFLRSYNYMNDFHELKGGVFIPNLPFFCRICSLIIVLPILTARARARWVAVFKLCKILPSKWLFELLASGHQNKRLVTNVNKSCIK